MYYTLSQDKVQQHLFKQRMFVGEAIGTGDMKKDTCLGCFLPVKTGWFALMVLKGDWLCML